MKGLTVNRIELLAIKKYFKNQYPSLYSRHLKKLYTMYSYITVGVHLLTWLLYLCPPCMFFSHNFISGLKSFLKGIFSCTLYRSIILRNSRIKWWANEIFWKLFTCTFFKKYFFNPLCCQFFKNKMSVGLVVCQSTAVYHIW